MCLELKELRGLPTYMITLGQPALLVWAGTQLHAMASVSSLPSADGGYPFPQCPWAWICLLLTRLVLGTCSYFQVNFTAEVVSLHFLLMFSRRNIWTVSGLFCFSNVCAIILNKNGGAKAVLKYISVNCLHVCFILRNVADLYEFVFRYLWK